MSRDIGAAVFLSLRTFFIDYTTELIYYNSNFNLYYTCRSKGDKQVIRSYPESFLSEVIYSATSGTSWTAFCLVGSSQGAAAVFNAIYENAKISYFMAVMDPVCHSPLRFSEIKQPSLLIYDTEDAGHPVSVGRIVKSVMPNTMYFEFTKSKQPNWISDNMASKMLELFTKNEGLLEYKSKSLSRKDSGCCITGYGLVKSWLTAVDREWPSEKDLLELDDIKLESECNGGIVRNEENDLFFEKSADDDDSNKIKIKLSLEEEKSRISNINCVVCNMEITTEPLLRLLDCLHGICSTCIEHTLSFNCECPLTDCKGSLQIPTPSYHEGEGVEETTATTKLLKPSKELLSSGILVKYGNNAVKSGGRYTSTAFIKADKSVLNQIQYVTFNINPAYPKSAVKVSEAPFELTRTMVNGFPCDMTIYWKTNRPSVKIEYYIQTDKPVSRKLLLIENNIKNTNTTGKSKTIIYRGKYAWSDDRDTINLSTLKLY